MCVCVCVCVRACVYKEIYTIFMIHTCLRCMNADSWSCTKTCITAVFLSLNYFNVMKIPYYAIYVMIKCIICSTNYLNNKLVRNWQHWLLCHTVSCNGEHYPKINLGHNINFMSTYNSNICKYYTIESMFKYNPSLQQVHEKLRTWKTCKCILFEW